MPIHIRVELSQGNTDIDIGVSEKEYNEFQYHGASGFEFEEVPK